MIDYKDRGPITEEDLMPIKNDDAAMFASDDDILFFHHFYERGKEEVRDEIRNKIQREIDALNSLPTLLSGPHLSGRVDGLEKALSLI